MWIWIEGGNKFSGHVCEGWWIGINKQSKGVRVYWPDKRSVTVERNVYYNGTAASASHIKGEIEKIIETKANIPAKHSEMTNALNVSVPSPTIDHPAPALLLRILTPPAPEPTAVEPPTTKHICKPSQHVADLIEGHGTTSAHPSDPILSHGIQPPSTITEELNLVLEGEGQAEWMMWMNFVEKLLMASEMSDAEALEP